MANIQMTEYATGAAGVDTSDHTDTTPPASPPRTRQRRTSTTAAKPAEKPAAAKSAARKTTTRTTRATKPAGAKTTAKAPAKKTSAKASTRTAAKASTTRTRAAAKKAPEAASAAPDAEAAPTPTPEPAVAPVVDLAAARAQKETAPEPEPRPAPPPPALPALPTVIAAPNLDNHYGDVIRALNLLTIADPRLVGMSAEVTQQGLCLRATDYTTSAVAYVDAHFVGDTGQVTLDHDQVKRVLTGLTAPVSATSRENLPVTVGLGANPTIAVNGWTVPLKVRTGEFPDLPGPAPLMAEVQRHELATAAAHVAKSRSRDDKLTFVTGIHVTVSRDGVHLEATDRFRCTRATVAAERIPGHIADRAGGVPVSILVPGDLIARAAAALPAGRVGIGIDTQAGRISLTSGHARVVINQLGTEFPKTAQLWAKKLGGTVEVPRLELLNQVKTAIAAAKALNGQSTAMVDIVTDAEEIYARPVLEGTFGDGKADPNEAVDVPKVHAYGEGLPKQAIRFDGKYLTDALETFTGATVALATGQNDLMAVFAEKLGDLTNPTAMRVLLMSIHQP